MNRRERVAAFVAGAVVATIAAGSAVVLGVHGAAPVTTDPADARVPADLGWAVFWDCLGDLSGFSGGISMSTADDGVLTVGFQPEEGTPEPDPKAVAQMNACFARHPIEQDFSRGGPAPLETSAVRLVRYDLLQRWLLPCLAGHGADIASTRGGAAAFLSDRTTFWDPYSIFNTPVGPTPLEEVLAARRACGAPTAPFE